MSNTSPIECSSPIRAIDPALLSLPSTPASTALPTHIPDSETREWLAELPEPFESHFYTSLAETSQSTIQSPCIEITDLYQTSHFRALPDATRSAAQSPRAPSTGELNPIRAYSQPPEEIPPPNSPPRPRRSQHPYPAAQFRHLQKQTSQPYARPSGNRSLRSLAPTSAPTPKPSASVRQYLPNEPSTPSNDSALPSSGNNLSTSKETFLAASRSHETSTSISIADQVSQIKEAVSSLQTFISHAFSAAENDPARKDVERARHTARQHNHTLTELHEFLTPLPFHAGALPSAVAPPITGDELRRMNHAALDALLDAYDVAFSPGMFLWEKKGLYLRFVGAGRGLMHRVLD
ncbi:hypothetical protein MMC11_007494 [Xylographa trunciseda]|nr:hypothetical protein [Xylographa trunciseda]